MKKVKFYPEIGNFGYGRLTPGKVYDVIKVIHSKHSQFYEIKVLINDEGMSEKYYTYSSTNQLILQDAIKEFRSKTIDDILSL